MTSIPDWKRWVLYNLIGEGIHNILFDDQIKKLAGNNYEQNLIIALNSLIDSGILLKLETNKRKKYIVNYDRLNDAQKILNDTRNWKLNNKEDTSKNVNQYFAEPEGYVFWFNIDEKSRKKGSIYNIYHKKTDDLDFAAQIITQKYFKSIYLGSLIQNNSNITKLWNACQKLSKDEKRKEKGFILQDLQDEEREACGNNRQRGKIALAIFKKLGYIIENGKKGNSINFKLTGKNPPFITLDELLN